MLYCPLSLLHSDISYLKTPSEEGTSDFLTPAAALAMGPAVAGDGDTHGSETREGRSTGRR
jgi:hypothetical protein